MSIKNTGLICDLGSGFAYCGYWGVKYACLYGSCAVVNSGADFVQPEYLPGFDTIMRVINALGMHLKTTAHTS